LPSYGNRQRERERERVSLFAIDNGSLAARKGQCPSMPATKQQKKNKLQVMRCNKNLPNLVSTVTSTRHVISQYLFTSADKMKYDLKFI